MALSPAMDNYTGSQPIQPKIIPASSEGCIAPQSCQYLVDTMCSLEECPFKSNKTLVGANTTESINTLRKCCICGNNFNAFIGAVPICPTCMDRLKYLVAEPHCPGCGRAVSTPATLCSSCEARYSRDT